LSIDLELQKKIDQLMDGHKGAAVLINARTGEILVLSSHPYFDPNNLDNDWQTIIQDPTSPLLNRATQSRYSPGTVLGPFLLTLFQNSTQLPDIPERMSYFQEGAELRCAIPKSSGQPIQWADAIQYGCPNAIMQLASQLQPVQIQDLLQKLKFNQAPEMPIAVAMPDLVSTIQHSDLVAIGAEDLYITPIQLALASAAITNNGALPSPLLTTAIQSPQGNWIIVDTQSNSQALLPSQASFARQLLTSPNSNYWQTIALAQTKQITLTWFIGGTITTSSEVPLATALVLEEDNPTLAQQIGQVLLTSVINLR
jgi:peptidoglycan glycosyltransferase